MSQKPCYSYVSIACVERLAYLTSTDAFKQDIDWGGVMAGTYAFDALPDTLHHLLDEQAARHGERTYAMMGDTTWTYAEIAAFSLRIASGLQSAGVRTGERVMLMLPPGGLHLGLWFGISRVGAVETPVNPAYKGMLLRQLIETAEPSLCVIHQDFIVEFRSAAEGLVAPDRIVLPDTIENDMPFAPPAVEADPRQPSCIVFTSGTTGRSKGVVMSHRHQMCFGQSFREIAGLTEADTTYNFLPFFHVAAKFVALGTMLAGGRMLLRSVFSVSNFWTDVRAHQVTVSAAVGGLCHMLNSQPPRPDDAENPLRIIYAVPVPWEFKADFQNRFGVEFIEGYGATESNLVAYSRLSDPTPRGAAGRASPHFEIEIQDAFGNREKPGQAGEICVRPRHPATMMSGYFGMPDKTLEVLTDCWFHTGDRGYLDENGYLYFLDRQKDAIRRRGENISSFEVERVLNAFPAISECAVIPMPSEVGEEEVKAIIVLKEPGSVTAEDIFHFAMANMPYFMVPRFIEFRNELPRTPTMKIRKTELRVPGNSEATWDCEKVGLKISRAAAAAAAQKARSTG
ncbi:AMP-binding protein [Xanthobacter sp. KR7-225]